MKKFIVLFVAIVIFMGLTVFWLYDPNVNTSVVSAKKQEGMTEIEFIVQQGEYAYGDNIRLLSAITNHDAEAKTYKFNSTCTQGLLFIDAQPAQTAKVCDDALTDVEIAPGETYTNEYELKLVQDFSAETSWKGISHNGELRLGPGTHTAYVYWQGMTSAPIVFEVVSSR